MTYRKLASPVTKNVGQSDHTINSEKTKLMTSFCHLLRIAFLNIATCLSLPVFNCCFAVVMLGLIFFCHINGVSLFLQWKVGWVFRMVLYYFDISNLKSCHVLTRRPPANEQMLVHGWGRYESLSGQLWVSLIFDDIYSS